VTQFLARPKRFAVAACVALFFGMLGSISSVHAVSVVPGTIGGFEADGNLGVNVVGDHDWANVAATTVLDDTLDSGFQGSSKEEEPGNWKCNTGGASPPKGNILHADANLSITSNPDSAFLNLAFVRESGLGDTHVNFEFNQEPSPIPAAVTGDCPINRSVGDFLVTYDFAGGDDPANIRAWTWNGSHWEERTLQASDAAAATSGGREFGELGLNLLADGLPGVVGCPSKSAVVNVRSRSAESITSALQDKLPTTEFSLDTCGTVTLHKVDNHTPPNALAGATFGLYANSTAIGTPFASCTSAADGTCTFDSVPPGDYSVKETEAPAGYSPDPSVRTLTVGFHETVDLTTAFVDPRDTGFIHVIKQLQDGEQHVVVPVDAHALDGTTFVASNAEATGTCTITGGAGTCNIGPLPTGNYMLHESVAPIGTTAGADVAVAVQKSTVENPTSITFVNVAQPLNLGLVKSGPLAAHVGDTFTYSFSASTSGPRLHGIALADLVPTGCTSAISGPTGDDADGFLSLDESWHWTCTHTVVASDVDPLPNSARVSGMDDFGRPISATADHSVDILKPGISIVKSAVSSARAGDIVTYSFAVTNTGDVALTGVEVNDNKLGTIGTIPLLGVGATSTLTKGYTIPAGAAVDNTATACGDDPLQFEVCGHDDHHLVVIHPAIQIVKSGPTGATAGQVVTYSFAVTNTGDVPLTSVEVIDDKIGTIGTIPSLAVGAITTLTKDFTVPGGNGVDNIATACGDDPLRIEVCDEDSHHLAITRVLGETETARGGELPRTGVETQGQLLLAGLAVLVGCLARRIRRHHTLVIP
jgi:uncharacterized repeat protein (TIGR01451 family)